MATCPLGLIAPAWSNTLLNIALGQFRHCRENVENLSMSSRDKLTFLTCHDLTRHKLTYFQQPDLSDTTQNRYELTFMQKHILKARENNSDASNG